MGRLSEVSSLTSEEVEKQDRGKKKVRSDDGGFTRQVTNPQRVEDCMRNETEGKDERYGQRSYRDSLLNKKKWRDRCFIVEDEEDEDARKGFGVGFEDVLDPDLFDFSDLLCPKFMLEKKERERLYKPFAKLLILKLLGKLIGYNFLESKLCQIWGR